MMEKTATVFSNLIGITIHVCLRRHENLLVGHACLTLRKYYWQPAQSLLVDHSVSSRERRHS